jgi:hypothetical protein
LAGDVRTTELLDLPTWDEAARDEAACDEVDAFAEAVLPELALFFRCGL